MKQSTIVGVLLRFFGVPDGQVTPFIARLRNLHRLGLLQERRSGKKGKAAEYTAQDAVEVGVAMQITLAGVGPEKAVEIVRAHRPAIARSIEERLPCSILLLSPYQTARPIELRVDAFKIADEIWSNASEAGQE